MSQSEQIYTNVIMIPADDRFISRPISDLTAQILLWTRALRLRKQAENGRNGDDISSARGVPIVFGAFLNCEQTLCLSALYRLMCALWAALSLGGLRPWQTFTLAPVSSPLINAPLDWLLPPTPNSHFPMLVWPPIKTRHVTKCLKWMSTLRTCPWCAHDPAGGAPL